MFRVLGNQHYPHSTNQGERGFPKSWGLQESVSFLPLPLSRHSFFFFFRSCPNVLDELARKRLLRRLTSCFQLNTLSNVEKQTVRCSEKSFFLVNPSHHFCMSSPWLGCRHSAWWLAWFCFSFLLCWWGLCRRCKMVFESISFLWYVCFLNVPC